MPNLIFIAGAPGVGKSTIAKKLHEELKSPFFEFGWIPEFRTKGEAEIPYEEEEQLAFENLVLVLQNYIKHGFKNILVTDLEDKRIQELQNHFQDYKIITLTISDEAGLKKRILDPNRKNDFRDSEKSVAINREILSRPLYPNEIRIDTTKKSIDEVFTEVKRLVG
jgi:broad-specificity NMP kinase